MYEAQKVVSAAWFEATFPAQNRQIITSVQILPAHDSLVVTEPFSGDFNALWDTGATSSAISTRLAENLQLPWITEREIRGLAGSYIARGFLAALRLPNNVTISEIVLYEWPGTPAFGLLIGMDVISMGDFMLSTSAGLTRVRFQIPSSDHKPFFG